MKRILTIAMILGLGVSSVASANILDHLPKISKNCAVYTPDGNIGHLVGCYIHSIVNKESKHSDKEKKDIDKRFIIISFDLLQMSDHKTLTPDDVQNVFTRVFKEKNKDDIAQKADQIKNHDEGAYIDQHLSDCDHQYPPKIGHYYANTVCRGTALIHIKTTLFENPHLYERYLKIDKNLALRMDMHQLTPQSAALLRKELYAQAQEKQDIENHDPQKQENYHKKKLAQAAHNAALNQNN